MKGAVFIVFIFALLAGVPARAETYKPGSIGYLYENCLKALAESKDAAALHETYCGAFAEGYFSGALVSGGGMKFGAPNAHDPCADEKQKAYERINGKFCSNLPVFDEKKPDMRSLLGNAAETASRWILYLQKKNPKKDPLVKPAISELGTVIRPGPFCETLGKPAAGDAPAPAINPALLRVTWQDVLNIRQSITLRRKYEQCKADLAQAGGSEDSFLATRCGAEVSGFLSGVQSASWLQKREKPSKACAKQIDRLYKSFDVAETMCVKPDTNPMRIAKIFLDRAESMMKNKNGGQAGLNGFGAVGYEAVYRGFLCSEKRP